MNIQITIRLTLAKIIAISLLAAVIIPSPGQAAVQPVSVPSLSSSAAPGGNGDSLSPILSPDGRYVLFASLANNLATGSNGNLIPLQLAPRLNVFLRDRTNNTTTLVSVNMTGTDGGNNDSLPSAISANGQFALFESSATNLVANPLSNTNLTTQIFLRDMVNNITTLISVTTNGSAGNGTCRGSVMTPDGRYVAYASAASNLVIGDTNKLADVFRYDTQTSNTTLISVGAAPNANQIPGGNSELPVISADGRYVAFYSTATNIVPAAPTIGEIFLRDTVAGTTTWASTNSQAILYSLQNNSNAICCNFSLSDDGRFVAYEACTNDPSSGGNAVAASLLGGVILQFDNTTGLTTIVNTNALAVLTGTELSARSLSMTPDGRFIAFVANAGNTSGQTCVDVWNSLSSTTTLASGDVNNNVPAASLCYDPVMDATGRYVAFLANASHLTPNSPASGFGVFLRDMQAGTTTWVDANGFNPSTPENLSDGPCLSTNGACVAFDSLGEGLVANDNNHVYNVFAFDVPTQTIELVSTNLPALSPASPNGPSTVLASAVSTNGRYVAFYSEADDITSGDTNGFRDVFVRDILSGSNYLVSVNTNGTGPGNNLSTSPAISGSGRYVVFTSSASNLVTNDNNNFPDVFMRDMETGTTTLVSVNANTNGSGDGSSSAPSISADGRYVVFLSTADNLAAGSVTNANGNLYWRDTQAQVTRPITAYANTQSQGLVQLTVAPNGNYVAFCTANSSSYLYYVWSAQSAKLIYTNAAPTGNDLITVSSTGTRIVYNGSSNQVVAADTVAKTSVNLGPVSTGSHKTVQFSADNQSVVYASRPAGNSNQIYWYNYATGSNILVSKNYSNAGPGNGDSDSPAISSDGLYVAYRSAANNLAPGVNNGVPNIFLYSVQTGTTLALSSDASGFGAANNRSLTPVFSGGNDTLVFESWATDLVPGAGSQWGNIFAFQPYSSGATNAGGSFVIQNFALAPTGWQTGAGAVLAPSFTWLTTPGESYLVQFTDNLSDPDWQTLTNNVSVVGGEGYAMDLAPANGQRFYRVMGAP